MPKTWENRAEYAWGAHEDRRPASTVAHLKALMNNYGQHGATSPRNRALFGYFTVHVCESMSASCSVSHGLDHLNHHIHLVGDVPKFISNEMFIEPAPSKPTKKRNPNPSAPRHGKRRASTRAWRPRREAGQPVTRSQGGGAPPP